MAYEDVIEAWKSEDEREVLVFSRRKAASAGQTAIARLVLILSMIRYVEVGFALEGTCRTALKDKKTANKKVIAPNVPVFLERGSIADVRRCVALRGRDDRTDEQMRLGEMAMAHTGAWKVHRYGGHVWPPQGLCQPPKARFSTLDEASKRYEWLWGVASGNRLEETLHDRKSEFGCQYLFFSVLHDFFPGKMTGGVYFLTNFFYFFFLEEK